jgi:hypothetical protein
MSIYIPMLKQVVTLAVSQTPQILLSRIDCLSQLKIIFPIIEIVNKDIVQNRGYLCADNKMKQFSVGQRWSLFGNKFPFKKTHVPLPFLCCTISGHRVRFVYVNLFFSGVVRLIVLSEFFSTRSNNFLATIFFEQRKNVRRVNKWLNMRFF